MKLSDINRMMKGTRAIKRVELPLINVPGPLQKDQPELAEMRAEQPDSAPQTVEIGVRVLTGEDQAYIYEKAWISSKARGCEKPSEQDPLYALMSSAWTLALACVDPDTDPARPALFFGDTPEAAFENVLSWPHLGRDGIAYLCEAQELWQDMCNPQANRIDQDVVWGQVMEALDSDDPRPFLQMRQGLRWNCMRFMAAQLRSSRDTKSASGSPSESSGTSDEPSKATDS